MKLCMSFLHVSKVAFLFRWIKKFPLSNLGFFDLNFWYKLYPIRLFVYRCKRFPRYRGSGSGRKYKFSHQNSVYKNRIHQCLFYNLLTIYNHQKTWLAIITLVLCKDTHLAISNITMIVKHEQPTIFSPWLRWWFIVKTIQNCGAHSWSISKHKWI